MDILWLSFHGLIFVLYGASVAISSWVFFVWSRSFFIISLDTCRCLSSRWYSCIIYFTNFPWALFVICGMLLQWVYFILESVGLPYLLFTWCILRVVSLFRPAGCCWGFLVEELELFLWPCCGLFGVDFLLFSEVPAFVFVDHYCYHYGVK